MRFTLHAVPMDGVVVIGEGEKDEAPDALQRRADRRRQPARGRRRGRPARGNAADREGAAERACRWSRWPSAAACSTRARASTWRRSPAAPRSPTCSTSTGRSSRRCGWSRKRKGSDVSDLMVIMLDRERHAEAVAAIRNAGARIRFITDGDVSAALLAVTEERGVDLLWGIGGTPEGVLSAAAIKCDGRPDARAALAAQRRRARARRGGRLRPRRGARRRPAGRRARTCSSPPPASRTATCSQGVRYQDGAEATTESLVMRSRSGHGAQGAGHATTASSCAS